MTYAEGVEVGGDSGRRRQRARRRLRPCTRHTRPRRSRKRKGREETRVSLSYFPRLSLLVSSGALTRARHMVRPPTLTAKEDILSQMRISHRENRDGLEERENEVIIAQSSFRLFDHLSRGAVLFVCLFAFPERVCTSLSELINSETSLCERLSCRRRLGETNGLQAWLRSGHHLRHHPSRCHGSFL